MLLRGPKKRGNFRWVRHFSKAQHPRRPSQPRRACTSHSMVVVDGRRDAPGNLRGGYTVGISLGFQLFFYVTHGSYIDVNSSGAVGR